MAQSLLKIVFIILLCTTIQSRNLNKYRITQIKNNPGIILEDLGLIKQYTEHFTITTIIPIKLIIDIIEGQKFGFNETIIENKLHLIRQISEYTKTTPPNFIEEIENLQNETKELPDKHYSINYEKKFIYLENYFSDKIYDLKYLPFDNSTDEKIKLNKDWEEVLNFMGDLIETIRIVHQNRLPKQLFILRNLQKIRLTLQQTGEFYIPKLVNEGQIVNCENIITTIMYYYKNLLFINFYVPAINEDRIKFKKIYNLPTFYETPTGIITNNIKIKEQYIGIDVESQKTTYFLYYQRENFKLCEGVSYYEGSIIWEGTRDCISNILKNQDYSKCETYHDTINNTVILSTRNGIIYATSKPFNAFFNCKNFTESISLKNNGLIQLGPVCSITIQDTTYTGSTIIDKFKIPKSFFTIGLIAKKEESIIPSIKFSQRQKSTNFSKSTEIEIEIPKFKVPNLVIVGTQTAGVGLILIIILTSIYIICITKKIQKQKKSSDPLQADIDTIEEGRKGVEIQTEEEDILLK